MSVYKNILVVNLGGIGDAVISIPFLRNLKRSFPRARVTALVSKRASEVLKGIPYIDEVIPYDLQGLRWMDAVLHSEGFFAALRFLFNLRKRGFDLAVNLQPHTSFVSAVKMAVVFYTIGARVKAGRDTMGRGFFYQIKAYESSISEVYETEIQKRLLEGIGGHGWKMELELSVHPEDDAFVCELLRREGVGEEMPLVAINPGSDYPTKRWPVENFIKVVEGLSQTYPLRFLVVGSNGERPLGLRIKGMVPEVVVLSGETTLGQLAALLKRVSLFITNDTGPMHMALALKVPTIAICGGPSFHKGFFPPDIQNAVVIRKDVDCSPCLKRRCDEMKCLKLIEPGEVVDAASALLTLPSPQKVVVSDQ